MNKATLSDTKRDFIQDKLKQQQQQQQHGAADSSAITGNSSLTELTTTTSSMTSGSSSSPLRNVSKRNNFDSGPLSLHLKNQELETQNKRLLNILSEPVQALEKKPHRTTNNSSAISQDHQNKIQSTIYKSKKDSNVDNAVVVKKPNQQRRNIESLVHQISFQTGDHVIQKKTQKVHLNADEKKDQQQTCSTTRSESIKNDNSMDSELFKTQQELKNALDLIREKDKQILQMKFEIDRLSSDLNWSERGRKELSILLEMSQVGIEGKSYKNDQGNDKSGSNDDESEEDDDDYDNDGDVSFSTPLASALRKMPDVPPSCKVDKTPDDPLKNMNRYTSSHLLKDTRNVSTMDVPKKKATTERNKTMPSQTRTNNNNNIIAPQQRYQPTQIRTHVFPETSMFPNAFAVPQNNNNMLGLVVTTQNHDEEQDTIISDLYSHAGASRFQESSNTILKCNDVDGKHNVMEQPSSSFEKEIAEFYNDK